jgi:hypothetical protein
LYWPSIFGLLTTGKASSSSSSFAKTTVFFAVAVGRENPPPGADPGKPGKGGGVFLSIVGRVGILGAFGLSSSESYPKNPPYLPPITGSGAGFFWFYNYFSLKSSPSSSLIWSSNYATVVFLSFCFGT